MSIAEHLSQRVRQSIESRQLFRKGDVILVGVSGGLDSMVLLHLLSSLAISCQWRLVIAHFNHQLRGRSSEADERLVKRAARQMGWRVVVSRNDVRKFSQKNKISVEMAARELRHNFFARTARKCQSQKLALAHHADDQVELFFLRLMRGAGGESLAGMKWKNPSPADARLKLVRPLLDQTKSTLAGYARLKGVAFREDASNSQLDFQRNRIRHELLPLLVKNYQPALTQVTLRHMKIIGEEARFVGQAAAEWLERPNQPAFGKLAPALQRRILHLQFCRRQITPNFELIEELLAEPDKLVNFSVGTYIRRDGNGILHVQKSSRDTFSPDRLPVHLTGKAGKISFENTVISWNVKPLVSGIFRAPQGEVNCENFDADKLGRELVLRHWRPGDRFRPLGMASSVKVQNLLVNQKIPRAARHTLLVGEAAGELFWVEGLRLGEAFKLDKTSRYQLKWSWKKV